MTNDCWLPPKELKEILTDWLFPVKMELFLLALCCSSLSQCLLEWLGQLLWFCSQYERGILGASDLPTGSELKVDILHWEDTWMSWLPVCTMSVYTFPNWQFRVRDLKKNDSSSAVSFSGYFGIHNRAQGLWGCPSSREISKKLHR